MLHEHFPEPVDATVPVPAEQDRNQEGTFQRAIQLFIQQTLNKKKPRDRQYIHLQPGGDYVFQKLMMQTPVEHLQRFEEMIRMAEALPAGDMHPPNQALQLEWFYMSFHQEVRAKYVESGWRLIEETLKLLAESFKNIYNSQVADGSLHKKRKCQIEQRVRRDMRHELCKRFDEKVRHATEQRYGGDNHRNRWPERFQRPNFKWQDHGNSNRRDTYDKCGKKQDDKIPAEHDKKHSSHARYTGLRVNTPLRSVTRIQGMQSVNPMTGSVRMKRITMTCATRAKTMSHAPALTHQPQVRIKRQLQVGAKNTKMRITIFKLPKE